MSNWVEVSVLTEVNGGTSPSAMHTLSKPLPRSLADTGNVISSTASRQPLTIRVFCSGAELASPMVWINKANAWPHGPGQHMPRQVVRGATKGCGQDSSVHGVSRCLCK